MTRITEEEFLQLQAKRQRLARRPAGADTPDEDRESKLQGKIQALCRDRAWPCLSFRQSKKAKGFITPGWPDMTIIIPLQARVVFLELKSKGGRRTKKQEDMAIKFNLAKHPIFEVRSFVQALRILEGEK